MRSVLSLIADPARGLPAASVASARRALTDVGCACGATEWLAEGEACEIAFAGETVRAREVVRAELYAQPVDVNALPAEGRRKRLLLADMDSTLIGQECIDELAAEIGVGERVAAITERAMRGEIAFEPALRERVALLRGLQSDVVGKVLAARITLTPGARILAATMRGDGAHTVLISGGFTAFAGPLAERIGMDEHRANSLEIQEGAFTGLVAEPILGREAKAAALVELSSRLQLEPHETLAVGDGANDLGMIRLAGLGVAFRAKHAVRTEAAAMIDHGDLTALLFLQGYRRAEFVDPGPA